MKRFRTYFEKIIEGVLFASSTITTITVIFIVIFLFSEGLRLFSASPVEKGYVLLTNRNNPVKKISASQLKKIYDQEISTWKEIGGTKDSIQLFTINELSNFFTEDELGTDYENLPKKINEFVSTHPNVLAYFSEKYIPVNYSGNRIEVDNISIWGFLTDKEWFPTAQPAAQFGILPLIMGTLWVSLGAILLALPFGLAAAIYMAEVADSRVRNILKPVIELLAGIPSVVYGFFGLIVIVPLIQNLFGLPVGETALSGSIVLGIMALPTIITISEDALRTTPMSLKEASLALGANRLQTLVRVTVPYAKSGITAAVILGIGRAMGETMAVLMVTGNAAVMPHSFMQPVRTIPATIAAELGEAPFGGLHFKALFALGIVLFIITLIINTLVGIVKNKKQK